MLVSCFIAMTVRIDSGEKGSRLIIGDPNETAPKVSSSI